MYAAASYALLEASANICNSTFFVSVDLKSIHLGTAYDDNFKTKFFHKFHWSIKSLDNSSSHPSLLLQISWIKSFSFTMIGEINPIGSKKPPSFKRATTSAMVFAAAYGSSKESK